MTNKAILFTLVVLVANYYATTFSIWFGHWFSHLGSSPLRDFHVKGHHAIYPHSRNVRSEVFKYNRGKYDSNFALLPWLILQTVMEYVFLPLSVFVGCLMQTTVITTLVGCTHIQFHLRHSNLERFKWFLKARRLHESHHDLDVNFMVADHFWDKRLGTFYSPELYEESWD